MSRKSPTTISAWEGSCGWSAAARSRSISMNRWSRSGRMARTTLSAQAGARKCCPNRRRGLLILDRLAAPELVLDLLDLVFAHPEVVAELVDHRFRDAVADVVLGLARL